MKRRLIKFSNYSFCITLPKKAVAALGWEKGENVEVVFNSRSKNIVVSKDTAAPEDIPKAKTKEKNTQKQEIKPIPKLRW